MKRHVEHGQCQKCQQINTSKNWCQPCETKEWQQDMKQLTGQKLIDKFIQQQPNYGKLEWIPHEQFTNIEHLAEGGFSKIDKAKWGKDEYGDDRMVALKTLNNSQNITIDFLTEIVNNKLVDSSDEIVKCHGISQDPGTKNYLMVMEYKEGGNLKDYLKSKARELSWEDKLNKLQNIAWGLNYIHKQGLVHRDFHGGNILNDSWNSYITDLGLSQPANSQKEEVKIFGVLPYVAPEILQSQPYTKASDIYSLGIIMYEMLTGLPPYYDREHDTSLALAVCSGLRPQFQIQIPQLLEKLIKRCWDTNPLQRLDVWELWRTLNNWWGEIRDEKDTEFTHQLQEAEAHNQTLPEEIKFPKYEIHLGAIYTSRLIDTKQITEQLNSLSLKSVGISSTQIETNKSEQLAQIEVLSKRNN